MSKETDSKRKISKPIGTMPQGKISEIRYLRVNKNNNMYIESSFNSIEQQLIEQVKQAIMETIRTYNASNQVRVKSLEEINEDATNRNIELIESRLNGNADSTDMQVKSNFDIAEEVFKQVTADDLKDVFLTTISQRGISFDIEEKLIVINTSTTSTPIKLPIDKKMQFELEKLGITFYDKDISDIIDKIKINMIVNLLRLPSGENVKDINKVLEDIVEAPKQKGNRDEDYYKGPKYQISFGSDGNLVVSFNDEIHSLPLDFSKDVFYIVKGLDNKNKELKNISDQFSTFGEKYRAILEQIGQLNTLRIETKEKPKDNTEGNNEFKDISSEIKSLYKAFLEMTSNNKKLKIGYCEKGYYIEPEKNQDIRKRIFLNAEQGEMIDRIVQCLIEYILKKNVRQVQTYTTAPIKCRRENEEDTRIKTVLPIKANELLTDESGEYYIFVDLRAHSDDKYIPTDIELEQSISEEEANGELEKWYYWNKEIVTINADGEIQEEEYSRSSYVEVKRNDDDNSPLEIILNRPPKYQYRIKKEDTMIDENGNLIMKKPSKVILDPNTDISIVELISLGFSFNFSSNPDQGDTILINDPFGRSIAIKEEDFEAFHMLYSKEMFELVNSFLKDNNIPSEIFEKYDVVKLRNLMDEFLQEKALKEMESAGETKIVKNVLSAPVRRLSAFNPNQSLQDKRMADPGDDSNPVASLINEALERLFNMRFSPSDSDREIIYDKDGRRINTVPEAMSKAFSESVEKITTTIGNIGRKGRKEEKKDGRKEDEKEEVQE